MNIRKFISAVICAAMIPCAFTGCGEKEEHVETEETAMHTAKTAAETSAETEAKKEIP